MSQVQVTVSKPAAQAQKPARHAAKGSVSKSIGAQETKASATVAKAKVSFALAQGFRPTAGRRLFAYTAAWMVAHDMYDGGKVPRSTAAKIAGSTAIAYHMAQGNIVQDETGLSLTEKGIIFFQTRPVDPEMAMAYGDFMTSGELTDAVCKNKEGVVTL